MPLHTDAPAQAITAAALPHKKESFLYMRNPYSIVLLCASHGGDPVLSDYDWFQANPFMAGRFPNANEPSEVRPLGDPSIAPIGIYLSQEAAHFIDTFVQVNPKRALGGILVGYVAESARRPFILITGAIEARQAFEGDGGIRFVSATWQYVREVWNREYPNTLMVGLFHSKPGQGTQLSEYDQFNLHRLLSHPWQVSFVIDPLRSEANFYRWVETKLVPLDSFYLWNPVNDVRLVNSLVKRTQAEVAATVESVSVERRVRRPLPLLVRMRRSYLWLVLILAVGLLGVFPRIVDHLPGTRETLRDAEIRLQALNERLEQEKTSQALLQTPAPQDSQPAGSDQTQRGQALSSSTATLGTTQPTDKTKEPLGPSVGYTVEPGDTLWGISGRLLGDPHAYKRLADMNAIPDPDLIYPGMSLHFERTSSQDRTEDTE